MLPASTYRLLRLVKYPSAMAAGLIRTVEARELEVGFKWPNSAMERTKKETKEKPTLPWVAIATYKINNY